MHQLHPIFGLERGAGDAKIYASTKMTKRSRRQ